MTQNLATQLNSMTTSIPFDVLEDLKLVEKCLKPSTILKLKENRVIQQSDSSNCGRFACKFLIDRFRNKTFAEATAMMIELRLMM